MMRFCTTTCQKWAIFISATVFLLLGILTVVLWADLVNSIKRHQLSLANENTEEYKMWKETPIPMYIDFYLFNWTNAQEVAASGWTIKPHFAELGPYSYSEHHIRRNITFNDNHTITYQTERIWHFLPQKSKGSPDDLITTLNPILATLSQIVKFKHAVIKMGVNFFLEEKKTKLTVTQKASEFLFDGYDDKLLDLVKKLNLTGLNIPFNRFGWFYSRNNSYDYDGIYNMYDGSEDITKLGVFSQWNYLNRTKYYAQNCGMVNGTSGELWYPVGNSNSVQVFSPDTCSSLSLVKESDIELDGVKGHKYVGTERNFDNGTIYPEMGCFSPGIVLPSGTRNVSQCKFGAPAFVSYPHFYLADPSYRAAVDGMAPNPTLHEFFIAIEPETGMPLSVQAAMQLNLRLEPIARIKLLENVTTIVLPAFWFKQYAEMTEDLAKEAKMLLILPSVGLYTGYTCIGLGVVLVAIGVFLVMRKRMKGREEEEPLTQEPVIS